MKILAIENDKAELAKLKSIFNDYGTCETASDGKEGLNKYHQAYLLGETYDLITIDLNLPDISGIDVLKQISGDENLLFLSKARKIIFSAESNPSNVIAAIANQGDAFIIKPLKQELLESKLHELGFSKKDIKDSN